MANLIAGVNLGTSRGVISIVSVPVSNVRRTGIPMNRTRMLSVLFHPSIDRHRFIAVSLQAVPIQVYGGNMTVDLGDSRDKFEKIPGKMGTKYLEFTCAYDLKVSGTVKIFPYTNYQASFHVSLAPGATGWPGSTLTMEVQHPPFRGVIVNQPFKVTKEKKQIFTSQIGEFQGESRNISFSLSKPHSDDAKTGLIIEYFVVTPQKY